MNKIQTILDKTIDNNFLSEDEIITLLEDNSDLVLNVANKIREKYVGNEVHLRGLIEFSNICKCHCKYCGLRLENKHIDRYRLSKKEVISFAKKGVDLGYRTIVLQSGEDSYFNTDLVCEIVSEIKKMNVALTLSIGERSFEDYKAFKDAGCDRYLIRIETTDRELYKKMHPNMDFDKRVQCLKDLKKLGYEVGSGCLVGLPEQTLESLAKDIIFFCENDFDMIGIGPFIPNPNTPLANTESPFDNFSMSLKVMAITRILLKNINIPATTAMETLNRNGRLIALQSGANVVMPNITEGDYRKKYEIYPNKICTGDTPSHCRQCISAKIQSIGRTISTSCGFRNNEN